MQRLFEEKRSSLISQGKRGAKEKDGKSRYEKRVKSKIASAVREFNQIDMQSLYKYNILTINIPVTGETDNYLVRIKFGGFLDLLRKRIPNNGKLDLRAITRALLDSFNNKDIYISCSCLHPDTKIKLLDGTTPTVEEMKARFDSGEKLYVYSTDKYGGFKPGEVEKVWIAKTTSEFIRVTLNNGKELLTTPDHLYMLRDGSYDQAQNLQIGQSLMPVLFSTPKDCRTMKLNSLARSGSSIYKLDANYYKSDEISKIKLKVNPEDNMSYDAPTHHIGFNKSNNSENTQIKIINIKKVFLESTPVYDIKVKDWHNFATVAGVVLHNCPDWIYRGNFWATIKEINSGIPENRPSKITNPKNNLGPGCKHIMMVLSNTSWLLKVASVIRNYILYMEKYRKKEYADIIYPAIYGKKYEEPVQLSIFDDSGIESDEESIDKANIEGRTRGQFKSGNPYRFQPKQNDKNQLKINIREED